MMLKTLLDDQIWEAHHWLRMAPGVHINCRMTLFKLDDGSILIHSAIPIDDALAAQIDALGEVSTIIAPNLFHHLFANDAHVRYPQATLHVAPGLSKKCPNLTRDHVVLGEGDAPKWHKDLAPIFVEGTPKFNETIFYHQRSSTLVVTDLLFNMHTFQGPMSSLVFRGMGTYKRFAQSKLLNSLIKDRTHYLSSLEPLRALDITRLIMAHGEVIEGPDTHARLLDALKHRADTSGR
jgi:hypothetical protein